VQLEGFEKLIDLMGSRTRGGEQIKNDAFDGPYYGTGRTKPSKLLTLK
jgi:hypothetical protein